MSTPEESPYRMFLDIRDYSNPAVAQQKVGYYLHPQHGWFFVDHNAGSVDVRDGSYLIQCHSMTTGLYFSVEMAEFNRAFKYYGLDVDIRIYSKSSNP